MNLNSRVVYKIEKKFKQSSSSQNSQEIKGASSLLNLK